MNLTNRTVLITGGTSGIGLGLAAAFHRSGSRVIVCGRDRDRLASAQERIPGVAALRCDLARSPERRRLVAEVIRRFPDLDVLVNNAGIQRYVDLTKGWRELKSGEDEIGINFVAVVDLTALFMRHLLKRPSAAIINVSSGLGFMPMLDTPVYNATKAAVHTYTLVLREQLKDTPVKVIEIVPPMVDTGLNRAGREAADVKFRGIAVSKYIPAVMKGLRGDADMIFYGDGEKVMTEPRADSERLLLDSPW